MVIVGNRLDSSKTCSVSEKEEEEEPGCVYSKFICALVVMVMFKGALADAEGQPGARDVQ